MSRTPLILIIMKLPFQAAKFLLYVLGSITYLPIYLYCLIFSKFLFSDLFETSPIFYVLFCLPRALISLGAFATAAAELYLIYWGIGRYIDFQSKLAVIITLTSIAIVTIFSFRFGYKLLFEKLKFPKLKSVSAHLKLVYYAFEDILSAIFTVLTVCMIFRAKQLFGYQSQPAQRKYLGFSFNMLLYTFYDVLGLLSMIILVILPWRFPYTRRVVSKINTEEGKLFFKIYQALNALFDIVFVPMFLITLLNPFFKCKRLFSHMNKLSVIAWRRLVFDEFISTLLDIPSFAVLLLSTGTIYQLPLSCTLYKSALDKIQPYAFTDAEHQENLKKLDNHQVQDAFNQEIYKSNHKQDSGYRGLCFLNFFLVILDLLVLISNLVLLLSIYRYAILSKKMATRRIDREQKPVWVARRITLTYFEYRDNLKKTMQLHEWNPEEEEEEATPPPTISTYPWLVISELFRFIFDIPALVIGSLLILAPWNWSQMLLEIKIHWNNLNSLETFSSFKCEAILNGLGVFWDYFSFAMFPVLMLIFWRWNYTFTKLAEIIRAGFINDSTFGYMKGVRAFDYFVLETLIKVIADLIFAPFILLFAPFLIFCPWRIGLLVKCLRATTKADFHKHRIIFIKVGFLAFCDFLQLIPLLISIITLVRIPTLWRMLKKSDSRRSIDDPNQLQIGLIDHIERSIIDDVPANNPNPAENQDVLLAIQQEAQQQEEPPRPDEDQIRRKHKYIALLDAGDKTCILLFLDFWSLPFFILIYINCYIVKKYRAKVAKYDEAKNNAINLEQYFDAELDICFARFKYGFFSLADIVGKIVMTAIFLLLLWRMPTLFILISRQDLQEKSFSHEIRALPKLKLFGYLLIQCFLHFLKDLLYLPFFVLLILVTPWRSWPVLSQIYRYSTESTVDEQISEQRDRVLRQLWKGLSDIFALIQLVILFATLVRLPFLFMMIIKNRFPNSWLAKKLFTRSSVDRGDDVLETKLSWGRCINIAFVEFLRDLLCIPFGIIAIVLAPWRITTVFSILASQVDRIPTHEDGAKNMKYHSRREELVMLVWTVLTVDLPYFVLMILSCLTLYGAPLMIRAVFRYIWHFKRYHRGELSFAKEVSQEFKMIFYNLLKLVFTILILVLVFRVPSAFNRLMVIYKNARSKEKKKQFAVPPQEPKEGALTLNDMNWDVYGRMCQFLTVEDLAKLSQVNKKFNNLNKKDFYWEYQFKRDWSNYNNFDGAVSYKEKCVSAYLRSKNEHQNEPITQEQRDILRGSLYVLFEEFILSLRSIPQIPLLPFKFVSFILLKIFGPDIKAAKYCASITSSFIDYFRYWIIRDPIPSNTWNFDFNDSAQYFKNIHKVLVGWIFIIILRIISDIGFIISFILCLFIRLLSAGQVSPRLVVREDPNNFMTYDNTIPRENLVQYQYRVLRYPLYVLQFIFTVFNTALIIVGFAALPFICMRYYNWAWNEAVFGPCCSFLITHAITFSVLVTEVEYMTAAAPYFEPSKAFTEPILLLVYLASKLWNHVGKPLFIVLKNGIRALCSGFFKLLSLIGSAFSTAVTSIFKGLFAIGKGIYGGYIAILVGITKCTLKLGLVGDLFLTIFALVWMLWPIVIPFFLPNKIYFIPCGLICLVLIVIGYKEIQKVSNAAQAEQGGINLENGDAEQNPQPQEFVFE